MDEEGGGRSAVVALLVLEIIKEAIEEGTGEIAVAGMDNKSSRFVDDEDIGIFVDNIDVDRLGEEFEIVWWFGQEDGYDIAWLDPVVGFDRLVVDDDAAGLGSGLDFGTRDGLKVRLEVFVDAEHLLSAVNDYMMMFVKLGIGVGLQFGVGLDVRVVDVHKIMIFCGF